MACKLHSRGHRLCARQGATQGLCLSSEEACKERKVVLAQEPEPTSRPHAATEALVRAQPLGNFGDSRESGLGTAQSQLLCGGTLKTWGLATDRDTEGYTCNTPDKAESGTGLKGSAGWGERL